MLMEYGADPKRRSKDGRTVNLKKSIAEGGS